MAWIWNFCQMFTLLVQKNVPGFWHFQQGLQNINEIHWWGSPEMFFLCDLTFPSGVRDKAPVFEDLRWPEDPGRWPEGTFRGPEDPWGTNSRTMTVVDDLREYFEDPKTLEAMTRGPEDLGQQNPSTRRLIANPGEEYDQEIWPWLSDRVLDSNILKIFACGSQNPGDLAKFWKFRGVFISFQKLSEFIWGGFVDGGY